VIYPGSIERVDFGEVEDDKHFVIVKVEKGKSQVKWHKLVGRRFFDRKLELTSSEDVQGQVERLLPPPEEMNDAIGRLTLTYPREWEAFIDEPAIRRYAQDAFEFHFIRHPLLKIGARVPTEESLLGKSTADQLNYYWNNLGLSDENSKELKPLAEDIMSEVHNQSASDKTEVTP
jgi:exonuclease SbcD